MKTKLKLEKKSHPCLKTINKIFSAFVILTACFFIGACSEVKPWQKGNLAKKHMSFDPDPVESKFIQHMYNSKEAATGGYGIGGGGCGCN